MAEKKKGWDLAEKLKEVSKMDIGASGQEQIQYIHAEHIHPDERNFYELCGIDELAASIEFAGLQQPLRVRPGEQEGEYIIVSGHRRHAAIKQLIGESQDLYERFCQVPCIVERQSGATDEVEAMLQELRLIYGNSDTRRMSSADISKQAERVEMLLYQLKEAGVEFPGKMRDHVAEACKVSASKLGRLKVIRDKLIGDLKKDWETGDLKESVAYAFAQQTPEVQVAVVQYMVAHQGDQRKWWHEGSVTFAAKIIDKELRPRKCSQGAGDHCDHTKARLMRIATESNTFGDQCRDGECCHGCRNLGTCGYACPHLADEVAKAQEKAKAQRAKEKEQKARENEEILAPRVRLWKRFGEARAAAGLSWEEYTKKADVVAFRREKKVEDFEQGRKLTPSSGGLPYTGGDGVDELRIRPLVKAADALGCSVDYLLCRTDIREMAKAASKKAPTQAADAGELQWIPPTVHPQEGQMVALAFDFKSAGFRYQLDRWEDGDWCFASGTTMSSKPVGWFPLPPMDEEASTLGTGENNIGGDGDA